MLSQNTRSALTSSSLGLYACTGTVKGSLKKKKDLEAWELYADFFAGDFDIRIGRQQVVWGEADGLRINDIINPQDFKEFILPDYIDSRIPLWMARINYYYKDFTFEGIIIPDFKRNRFARHGSEWEFFREPAPGMILIRQKENRKPSESFNDWEWGIRIFRMMNEWELSWSYFYTWDDIPTYHRIVSASLLSIPAHHNKQNLSANNFLNRGCRKI